MNISYLSNTYFNRMKYKAKEMKNRDIKRAIGFLCSVWEDAAKIKLINCAICDNLFKMKWSNHTLLEYSTPERRWILSDKLWLVRAEFKLHATSLRIDFVSKAMLQVIERFERMILSEQWSFYSVISLSRTVCSTWLHFSNWSSTKREKKQLHQCIETWFGCQIGAFRCVSADKFSSQHRNLVVCWVFCIIKFSASNLARPRAGLNLCNPIKRKKKET